MRTQIDNSLVWSLVRTLESTGSAVGPSVYRDTVNHFYEMGHPGMCVIVDRINCDNATFSIVNYQDYFFPSSH